MTAAISEAATLWRHLSVFIYLWSPYVIGQTIYIFFICLREWVCVRFGFEASVFIIYQRSWSTIIRISAEKRQPFAVRIPPTQSNSARPTNTGYEYALIAEQTSLKTCSHHREWTELNRTVPLVLSRKCELVFNCRKRTGCSVSRLDRQVGADSRNRRRIFLRRKSAEKIRTSDSTLRWNCLLCYFTEWRRRLQFFLTYWILQSFRFSLFINCDSVMDSWLVSVQE